MPKICYVRKKFNVEHTQIINTANEIIADYQEQGFDLTLRQLYYRFVALGKIPNTVQSYKRLGSIINDARLAGLIDWDTIVDRTRELHELAHWRDPAQIIEAVASQFRIDKWARQPCRVEVWIEKDALAGVFERICDELDIAYLSCRGYTSQSEMWGSARRIQRIVANGQDAHILHFGDHDPSGLDMTDDIKKRLRRFGTDVSLERLALNMDQIEEYEPPPNPVKTTDSRHKAYVEQYETESSWELDALEPAVLADLVRTRVEELRDPTLWAEAVAEEEEHKRLLSVVSDDWDRITEGL